MAAKETGIRVACGLLRAVRRGNRRALPISATGNLGRWGIDWRHALGLERTQRKEFEMNWKAVLVWGFAATTLLTGFTSTARGMGLDPDGSPLHAGNHGHVRP